MAAVRVWRSSKRKTAGSRGAARTGQPTEQGEKLTLAGLGAGRRSRPCGIGHAEELEHDWQPLDERLVEQEHSPRHLVARRLSRVLFGYAEVAAEELENRPPRHCLPM
jgi:hypothetical protein